jgi:hypothetical protein
MHGRSKRNGRRHYCFVEKEKERSKLKSKTKGGEGREMIIENGPSVSRRQSPLNRSMQDLVRIPNPKALPILFLIGSKVL